MSATAAVSGVPGANPAAQPNGGAPAAQPAAPAAPWYGDIPDPELKGWAELKAFKSPVDALKTARDAEKLIGVEPNRRLTLPRADADQKSRDEAMGQIYDALGRPKTPDEYKIPSIEGDEASAKFTATMKPVLHSIGLTQDQALKLKTAWDGYIGEQVKAQEAAQAQQEQVDLQNLHTEWPGDVFTQREEMARRAVRNFVNPMVKDENEAKELLGQIEDSIGTAKFLKLFSEIGQKTGESRSIGFESQGNSTFGMTPAQAHARLQELKNDKEWGRKVLANPKGIEGSEMDRLMQIAAQRQSA